MVKDRRNEAVDPPEEDPVEEELYIVDGLEESPLEEEGSGEDLGEPQPEELLVEGSEEGVVEEEAPDWEIGENELFPPQTEDLPEEETAGEEGYEEEAYAEGEEPLAE